MTGFGTHRRQRLGCGRGAAVRAVRGERFENVGNRADPSPQIDLGPCDPHGIACSVDALVVLVDHHQLTASQLSQSGKLSKARDRVLANQRSLSVFQHSGLAEDVDRDVSFADVVDHTADDDLLDFGVAHPEPLAQCRRIERDVAGMLERAAIVIEQGERLLHREIMAVDDLQQVSGRFLRRGDDRFRTTADQRSLERPSATFDRQGEASIRLRRRRSREQRLLELRPILLANVQMLHAAIGQLPVVGETDFGVGASIERLSTRRLGLDIEVERGLWQR